MARLGMEVKEVSPLEYGVHQPGHEAVSAGMNAQQVEELTVAYIVRWPHRHLTREPTIGWVERFGCLATDPVEKQAHLPDRNGAVNEKRVAVRGYIGGRRNIKKKK